MSTSAPITPEHLAYKTNIWDREKAKERIFLLPPPNRYWGIVVSRIVRLIFLPKGFYRNGLRGRMGPFYFEEQTILKGQS